MSEGDSFPDLSEITETDREIILSVVDCLREAAIVGRIDPITWDRLESLLRASGVILPGGGS